MRRYSMILVAVVAATCVPRIEAQTTIFWLGGTGTIDSANYSNGTSTVAPASTDYVDFGNGGTGTLSAGTVFSVGKLRVGHGQTLPAPGGAGTGTVTISGGAQVF